MNNIEKMIQELCPESISSFPLGEIAEIKRGTSITRKNLEKGEIPVIAGGRSPAYYHDQSNRVGPIIVVAGSGAYAGYISFWTEPIFVSDAFTIFPDEKQCNIRYCYHWLKAQQTLIHKMKSGGGVPHVYPKNLAKLAIPLPPLDIQREIVRILDMFTNLEAELEAELEARKKQYQFYRDSLLSFANDGEVKWTTLGKISKRFTGLSGKKKQDFETDYAKDSFATYKNVFTQRILSAPSGKVSIEKDEKQNKLLPGDLLFTGSSENLEEVGMSSVVATTFKQNVYLNSFCIGFRLSEPANYDLHFLSHLLRSNYIRKQIRKIANGVTRINISGSSLEKIQIPIPPLEEQKRIADILDKFDALVNDISAGLPAEIEARRKQYEYYRDALLTFPTSEE